MTGQLGDSSAGRADALGEALRIYIEHRSRGSGESDSQLLSRHPDLRDLLEPLLAQDEDGSGELRRGVVLGDYRLVERIGGGGMGEVWEAEQISLRRRVALKLLRGALFSSPKSIERFRREALAGARLHHPCIVAVHAVGEDQGVHYIAQELVETRRTLSSLVRETRELPAIPPEYWRETAARFSRMADALDLAHRAGVIHRDLKPSNILLAADGTPKVADFGLALVAGESELSRTGDVSGSPYYMSPEQASAKRVDVDERSDVFSLGATLFEALTLQRPFEGDTVTQVLSKILFDDPRDPRDIRSLCPRDLAVICLKMLEKEPSRRYPSMRAVAEELERFLRSEPIRARPPGVVGRAVKWSRRHPVLAASGAILCVSMAVVSALLWENRRARHAAELSAALATRAADAEAAAAREAAEAARAADRAAEAARVEATTSARIVDFLVGAFEEASPTIALGREVTAREVLDRGVANIRTGLTGAAEAGPRARLLDSLGMVYSRLGLRAEAEQLLLEAKALAEQAFGPRHQRTLEVARELAILYSDAEDGARAAEFAREVWDALVADGGPESEAALAAEGNLGSVLSRAGRLDEAELHLRHSVEGTRRIGGRISPGLFSLSEVLRSRGKYAESVATLEECLAIYAREEGPDHPDTLNAREGLARHLIREDKFKEAGRLWREIAVQRACVQGPKHWATLRARGHAASLEVLQDPRRATEELRALHALAQVELGPDDATTVVLGKQLANLLLNVREYAEAEELLARSLASLARRPRASSVDRGGQLATLAEIERKLGRQELALALFEEIVEAPDAATAANGQVLDHALRSVIDLRDELGQRKSALEAARRWLGSASEDHPARPSVEALVRDIELEQGER